MRQKFTITESDRKHIKKLYEQEEPNNNESGNMELEIDSLVFATISEYRVKVGIKDDNDNDSVSVTIKMDVDSNVVGVELDYNYDDEVVSDEQAINFVTQKAKEGFFNNLPTYMAYDMEKEEPFDFD
jgi:hypothetical protein